MAKKSQPTKKDVKILEKDVHFANFIVNVIRASCVGVKVGVIPQPVAMSITAHNLMTAVGKLLSDENFDFKGKVPEKAQLRIYGFLNYLRDNLDDAVDGAVKVAVTVLKKGHPQGRSFLDLFNPKPN
jgi:hypothetical protein